jgi:hypothetical protein
MKNRKLFRIFSSISLVFGLLLALCFFSCNFPLSTETVSSEAESNYTPLKERIAVENLNSNFSKAV